MTFYPGQSDPDRNPQFRRRWTEPLLDAATLDRMADAELQHGHWHVAESLAWRAAAMREAAR